MSQEAPPRRGIGIGQIFSFLLGAAVVVFAVVNLDQVSVNFLAFNVTLPAFLLIIGTASVGFVVGFLLRGRGR